MPCHAIHVFFQAYSYNYNNFYYCEKSFPSKLLFSSISKWLTIPSSLLFSNISKENSQGSLVNFDMNVIKNPFKTQLSHQMKQWKFSNTVISYYRARYFPQYFGFYLGKVKNTLKSEKKSVNNNYEYRSPQSQED